MIWAFAPARETVVMRPVEGVDNDLTIGLALEPAHQPADQG